MTTFKQLKKGQEFRIPGSIRAVENAAIFRKETSKTFVQIFPNDDFYWMKEITPRVDIEVTEA